MISKIRNIGISAHIDSGKTTLSERILFYTGKIHKIEEVKGKSGVGATMDSMALEKEKGITIQSAATYCTWKDYKINLIDTPGHVDFTIEVERALRVLDGAVLVLCAVAGVQSQSITVDRQMKRYKVPRIAFINKMDRSGANPWRVIEQLKEKLHHRPIALQVPIGTEDKFEGVIDLLEMKAFYFDGANGESLRKEEIPSGLVEEARAKRIELVATLADYDDSIAEKYLSEVEISAEEMIPVLRRETLKMTITPVLIGSAYKNKGVQLLLDAVGSYLPSPEEVVNEALDQDNGEAGVILEPNPEKPFVGLAFKLEEGKFGQLTYLRVYQGQIKKGEFITNCVNGKKVKVPRLIRMHSNVMNDIAEAKAGDIVALFGVDCASGDTFTSGVNYTMTSMHVPSAVIDLAVWPKEKTGEGNFSKALNRFTKEDPTFRVRRDEESGQTIISGMGELHLEVYIERIKREYNCEVETGKPQVAYRETISKRSEFNYTHKKQSGGRGQFARVAGYIEPLPADAVEPYEFVNDTVGGSIPKEFIPACDKGFLEAVKEGSLIGFPVTGVRIVVNDGLSHAVDSSEQAFKTAAIMAFRQAYERANPVILEPVMKVEVSAPEEFQGSVMGQINQRRGVIIGSENNDGFLTAVADVPLSEMFGYTTELRSGTQGKGEFTMEFSKYAQAPRHEQEKLIKEHREKDK